MNKSIKILSYVMTALTALFFLSSFLGVQAEAMGLGLGVTKLAIYIANILLFVLPVLFLVIFAFGMTLIFRSMMAANRFRTNKQQVDKLPVIPYVMAIVSFILYLIFVSIVFAGAR